MTQAVVLEVIGLHFCLMLLITQTNPATVRQTARAHQCQGAVITGDSLGGWLPKVGLSHMQSLGNERDDIDR